MKLSKGAQAVRTGGGITLKQFREEVLRDRDYLMMADKYAAEQGISSDAAKRSTSKFTRLYLRTFYRKGVLIDPKSLGLAGPNSRLSRLLVATGDRPRGQEYQVGDTPTVV